jgi:DNA-binding response OmpR family regulator
MGVNILLVEDDSTARMLLADVLEGAGYQVTTARDGEVALELLSAQVFDVVITDIRMRQVDGIKVLEAARQLTPPPSVILLTGFGSLETAVAALRAGAHDYLLKPAAPKDLLSRVAKAVERRSAEVRQNEAARIIAQGLAHLQGHVPIGAYSPLEEIALPGEPTEMPQSDRYLHVGSLSIDTFRHTATFDNQTMHLTPIEYALLHCLAASQGRVVSYSEIVRCSHGYEPDEAEAQSLLKAHVRNLRRKINSRYLVNVRGTGYMLVDPDKTEDDSE